MAMTGSQKTKAKNFIFIIYIKPLFLFSFTGLLVMKGHQLVNIEFEKLKKNSKAIVII